MKTRFTPLVRLKKDAMEQCERVLQTAYRSRREAENALLEAYAALHGMDVPDSGPIRLLQQSRRLLEAQRAIVKSARERLACSNDDVAKAEIALNEALIEYEKFKYLEADQVKKMVIKEKRDAARELDEVAMMGFAMRRAQ